jgi:site-specific DNA recombinase
MVTMVAIGYARVSTDKQADNGISLEAQATKIRAMALVHGATLLDLVQDGGESAKTLNRPGLQRVLSRKKAFPIPSLALSNHLHCCVSRRGNLARR